MIRAARLFPGATAALLTLVLSNGCGYIGDPLPPALNLPRQVADLSVVQRGEMLVAQFTLPKTTTEGLPLKSFPDTELYAGESALHFDQKVWFPSARRVTDDTGKMRFEIPVGDFAGKDVVVALRLKNDNGRDAGWSNFVALQVTTPVGRPENLQLTPTAQGIKLTWTGSAPLHRVYRKDAAAADFAPLGDTKENFYIDATAEFAKPYEYYVQGLQKVGDTTSESEISETKPITAEDKFAPAVPKNLRTIVGTKTVEISWDRNTEPDLAGYRVYRAEGDGPFKMVAASLAASSYSDRDVKTGGRYRYRVVAFDRVGNPSDPCEPVEARVP